jgi:hypothetical protein
MTNYEKMAKILDAFVAGRIDRQEAVRQLVALGYTPTEAAMCLVGADIVKSMKSKS